MHTSLDWVFTNGNMGKIEAAISRIERDDFSFLSQIFGNIVQGKFSGKITFRLQYSEEHRWLQATPFLAEYKGERVLIASIADITDEIITQESVEKFANKKNSILHMLGHDLRGPLNVAKSVMKVVDREISDPIVLQRTGYIATILQQSIDMIGDLINREFLETTNTELVKERVDIVRKLDEYVEECRHSEKLAEITFHLRSSADKIFIKLDSPKFMQVVNNLISNSLKFTPPGGEISITVEENQQHVSIKFADNGIGIPESLMPDIFEKFTRARRPGLRGEPTTGLGLSIVKTILSWHEGRISCESKEGSGTTFLITMPKNLS